MLPSLDDLLLLVTIADQGSFTAASTELKLPKSTVSRRLADLEAQLGISVFRRSTRALSLTDEGQRIFDIAKPAVLVAQDAARAVAEREKAVSGRVTLTTTAALGEYLVAPRLPALVERYPALQVELRLTERRINIISDGVDLAIRMGTLEDSELVGRRLAKVKRFLVAAPAYATEHGLPLHPSDIAGHMAIVTSSALTTWRFADGWECPVRWQIAAGNMLAAHSLAKAGLGIALLPDFLVLQDLANGILVPVLTDYFSDKADAWLICSGARYRSAAVRAVFEVLTEKRLTDI